jgi:hypothetical protein
LGDGPPTTQTPNGAIKDGPFPHAHFDATLELPMGFTPSAETFKVGLEKFSRREAARAALAEARRRELRGLALKCAECTAPGRSGRPLCRYVLVALGRPSI